MSIGIVTDSTCDLPQHVIHGLGIKVIPLFINIGDKGYLDEVDITRRDFYTTCRGTQFTRRPAHRAWMHSKMHTKHWQMGDMPRFSLFTFRKN